MIIAFDGASTDLSIALAEPGGAPIADVAWTSAHRQSAELLPRLLALLDEAGRTLPETTAIGTGVGPGSFTGLRVAIALAKGLASGLRVPIFGVPSLVAWLAADASAPAAIARAGARDAYVLIRGEEAPVITDAADLGTWQGVVAPADVAASFGLVDARSPRAAAAIAAQAAIRMRQDPAGDDLGELEPLYLRGPRGVAVESQERVRWL